MQEPTIEELKANAAVLERELLRLRIKLRERLVAELGAVCAFTEREKEVLDLMMLGMQNKQIAVVINMAERTVKFHVKSVFAKAGVSCRSELFASRSSFAA